MKLPYVDVTIDDGTFIDHPTIGWWIVYNSLEGFQPCVYLIRADTAQDAEDIWCEQERNKETDTSGLVVMQQTPISHPLGWADQG